MGRYLHLGSGGIRSSGRLLGVLLLFSMAFGSWAESQGDGPSIKPEIATRAIVAQLSVEIAGQFDLLTKLAGDTAVQELLKAGDATALNELAAKSLANFKGGLRLRIIPTKHAELALSEVPPLSYAVLDTIRLAETTTEPVPAEMVMPGNPGQHILLVQRVADSDGKVLGVLALQLAPDDVAQSLSVLTNTVVELHQVYPGSSDSVLARSGLAATSHAGQPTRLPVRLTRWSLYAWLSQSELSDGLGITISAPLKLGATAAFASGLLALLLWYRSKTPDLKSFGLLLARVPLRRTDAVATKQEVADAIRPVDSVQSASVQRQALQPTDDRSKPEREHAMQAALGNTNPTVPDSIFRAYDIRGIVGEGLTEETVYLLGLALGSEAHERGQQDIVVARDGRTSGPLLIEALKKGLLDSGRDVIDIGMVPTPVLYWATYFLETHSGVMLTGSHNPSNYNGLKIVLDGRALTGEAIIAIRDRITKKNFTSGKGRLNAADLGADYIRRVTEDIPVALTRAFKVVVDCGNGIPGILAPRLIRALGHDVTELYCEVDGAFPNHHPDPSQPENLHDLITTVKELKADLGLAFDGDGDRLGVVDAEGNIIWPDRQMMLYARDVLSRNPGAEIIFDVKCSNHLQTVVAEHGGEPLMWKTGHSLIKTKMRESGAPLAGEMSGHIFFKERWYGFDDALYAAARLLEILVKDPRPPAAVFAELPGGVATPELRLDMPEGEHAGFMQKLIEQANFGPEAKITTVDGLRVDFADRWALVRPSNTTPCLILRFEADNQEALEKVQAQFRGLLTAVKQGIKLPF